MQRAKQQLIGIGNMVFATGSAVGAPLGGYLADTIGWRWFVVDVRLISVCSADSCFRSFLLQVPVALLAILAVSVALQLPKIESQDFIAKLKRVDFGGALTLVVAIFCLLLGLDRGDSALLKAG